MRKEWLICIGLTSLVLAGCSVDQQQQYTAPAQPAWTGPVVEIPGIPPKYEPLIASANQNYTVNGVSYRVVTDTSNFSQIGLASSYGQESAGNTTASGEKFDPNAYTAASPYLPIPSYARVTNLADGRQLVVRINDRGPFVAGRIIDLSSASAGRLNISNNTQVRVDAITVAPDGTLSGPGTNGTRVAIQSYDLPARPNLDSTDMAPTPAIQSSNSTALPATAPSVTGTSHVMPIANSSLQSSNSMGAPLHSNGFLGAPQPLASGVLEPVTPAATPPAPAAAAIAAPAAKTPASSASKSHGFVVQVAALNDAQRARQLEQKLSQRFGVNAHTEVVNGNTYRVQLGGYADRKEAAALQQRLSGEKINSFITTAP
ncbi:MULTISPECIES: endolytic peptidoglycan transglycosylase RlpA [unclassified Tatumella]|uniref:endolytic peptidoglycan transglycosylase RlpA n=1 Tax=unclassified Tatumella TaxID=2649542 RepID=UPI001BAE6273|nr:MULTISPECIES: endolytic peptidoglycan transglycosylase RlpA [unclassified Tatumella]MBS0875845.1 endolytic peptidoglycan transglycosylase RlpA [Tatumella sp. JGM82]MBS0890250.1 endolytic peptidoglycan transglycosylase RlpA [Tatumella sp. JGM94]MBS0900376.1 endolytic peptidoglycan transglycosylase RlpA [Tatumella sp. JGM100]